jgi:signal transduction histidine kinase/ActR/RegA family two-component response regulator
MNKVPSDKSSLLMVAALDRMSDLASQGILLTDGELRICGWNVWLERHTEFQASEVMGRHLFEVYPDLIERRLQRQYEFVLEGQVRVLSQRLHGYLLPMSPAERSGFRRMQQSARISPLFENGRVVGTVTLIDDVTERVAREAELQTQIELSAKLLLSEKAARTEAERANRLKDEFLATVSHELRTPLNAIMGWAHMLRSANLDTVTIKRAIETIHRNAQAQSKLISDLLDVSRIISGKLPLDRRTIDLSTVVMTTLDSARPAAEAKEVNLDSLIDQEAGPMFGDADRLQQVVWNLVSNAIKFTPRAGRVEVRLQRVADQIWLTVRDSGIGISPEFLPHVFDRFRQADAATTRSQGGLGLGLSIVRHLVELHGGTVSANSEGEGQGATFLVRFPALGASEFSTAVHPAETQQPLECPPVLRDARVLIVDDDADTRELLGKLLEQCGAHVRMVVTAAAAFDAVKETKPDLLISDIGMPGEDGYSLISRVRELPASEGGQTPAAALTAYATAEDQLRVLEAGFQVYLPKPIKAAEFLQAIASVVVKKE